MNTLGLIDMGQHYEVALGHHASEAPTLLPAVEISFTPNGGTMGSQNG